MDQKFCGSCGAQIKADAGFCPNCGAKQTVSENAEAANPAPAEATAPKAEVSAAKSEAVSPAAENIPSDGGVTAAGISPGKLKKYAPLAIIGVVAIIAIIVIIMVIVNLTKYTKIDGEELFDVSFSGIDGNGTATVNFAFGPEVAYIYDEYVYYLGDDMKDSQIYDYIATGYEEFVDEYENELSDEERALYKDAKSCDYLSFDSRTLSKAFEKADTKRDAEAMRDAILECVSFDVSKEEGLKNGDTVTVTVEVDEEELKEEGIKIDLKDSYEVKVSGLNEGVELDPFADLSVSFSGVDGEGYCSVDASKCSKFVSDSFYFYMDGDISNYELSNGDTVTMTATFYGTYDEEIGGCYDSSSDTYYLFDVEPKKDYTVEGLTELTAVDVFEYIEIVYYGIAPDVYITIEWKDDTPEYIRENINISKADYDDPVDGESFTLEAYAYSDFKEEGYKLAAETKDYTYDFSLAPYYMPASEVTKDTYAAEFDETIKADQEGNVGGYLYAVYDFGDLVSVDKVEFVEAVYSVAKDEDAYTKNVLARIYKVTATFDDDGEKSSKTYYAGGVISNITAANGTPSEIDTYYISTGEAETLEEARSGLTYLEYEDYTSTTVK